MQNKNGFDQKSLKTARLVYGAHRGHTQHNTISCIGKKRTGSKSFSGPCEPGTCAESINNVTGASLILQRLKTLLSRWRRGCGKITLGVRIPLDTSDRASPIDSERRPD